MSNNRATEDRKTISVYISTYKRLMRRKINMSFTEDNNNRVSFEEVITNALDKSDRLETINDIIVTQISKAYEELERLAQRPINIKAIENEDKETGLWRQQRRYIDGLQFIIDTVKIVTGV